jgi:hypothetical protein
VAIKLRDAYWQELLKAALQESDTKHAVAEMPRRALEDANSRMHLLEGEPSPKKAWGRQLALGSSSDLRTEIDEFKIQLHRERAARWELVSGALALPITPGVRAAHVDVGSRIVAAAVAGDSAAVLQAMDSARLDSFESPQAQLLRCDTASILPLHRALAGFDFHSDAKKLLRTMSTLLDFGADVRACDAQGETVLHKALKVCAPDIAASTLDFLLNAADRGPCMLSQYMR